jgi:glycosyltransferase involved in cell wall biosynthesis
VNDELGLEVVSAPRVAPGLRFMPAHLRRWLEHQWLLQLERTVGARISVVWLFENSRFYDMRFAGSRLKIYHQVDLNQDFHPRTAARTADIVFCTTELIRQALAPYNSSIYKIHHGLAVDGFKKYRQTPPLKNASEVNAVYVGNLEMEYLDTSLLVQCVETFTTVRFHLVGGYTERGELRRRLGHVDNVVWWGKVDYREIPQILNMADILLVIYRQNAWHHQASPHKLMEYLACGNIIVATWTEEYRDKRHLLEMVDDWHDFLPTFSRVANNLSYYNAPERQKIRQDFAFGHSYGRQLGRIRKFLASKSLLDRFDEKLAS